MLQVKTKLEQKLQDLGYEEYENEVLEEYYWYKQIGIWLIVWENNDLFIDGGWKIRKQNQIDYLQEAFNEMQKDLKELEVLENDK